MCNAVNLQCQLKSSKINHTELKLSADAHIQHGQKGRILEGGFNAQLKLYHKSLFSSMNHSQYERKGICNH